MNQEVNIENVILVDEQDNELGVMEKMEAHLQALLHRAVSVFIVNSKGEWLLQQRNINKYHSKGLWSNTCCSHPRQGESSLEAANRRLFEEMGLESSISEIFHFSYKEELEKGLTENELDHVFFGISDDIPVPNPVEVQNWKYIAFDELKNDIEANPDHYTVWFKKITDRVNSFVLQHF